MIQTTKIFKIVDNAINKGFSIISAQGSSRSSKTYNILIWLINYAWNNPKVKISVVRNTLPAIRGSVHEDFIEITKKMGIWDYIHESKTTFTYTLPNETKIEFFSASDEQKMRGRKRDVLFVNEANELTFLQWQQLKMRTRRFAIIDYNPSFTDDHWICQLNTDGRCYHFITTYKDNPFLEKTIIEEIESLKWKNPTLWQVYGLGLQAIIEGLIFKHFTEIEVIPDYIKKRYIGLDFGFTCFSGETLISTSKGQKRIDEIKQGDFVLTRKGYKRVKRVFQNGRKEVVTKQIMLSNNEKIIISATENHIFNINGKWKKYGELTKQDRLFIQSSLKESDIIATPMESTQTTITDAMEGMRKKNYYITLFGNFIKEIFRKDTLFITLMKTHLITIFQILWLSLRQNIVKYITGVEMTRICEMRIKNMDTQKRIGQKDEKKQCKDCRKIKRSVFGAVKNILQQMYTSVFVRKNATKNGKISLLKTMKNVFANTVEKNTSEINILSQRPAQDHAHIICLQEIRREICEVYDIEVDEVHEYFANGILVHNCDPTSIIEVGLRGNEIYIDEHCYQTEMLTSDIIKALKKISWLKIISESADPRLVKEISRAGLNIHPVKKYGGSIEAGITKMLEFKIFITKRSVNTKKELKSYTYTQNKDGKWLNVPIDAFNHCFVGETLVTTKSGQKRIDSIKQGDYILTSDGFKRAVKLYRNGRKEILHVKLFFGIFAVELKVTPNHLIKTTKGWKKVKELTKDDVLYVQSYLQKEKRCQKNKDKSRYEMGDITFIEVQLEGIEIVKEEIQEVFDIEVEGIHEYFANGVLVHNSMDAIRYVVLEEVLGGYKKPLDKQKLAKKIH